MKPLQLPIFKTDRAVNAPPEVESLLRANSPVAFGVSGGKDSTALAFAAVRFLDQMNHRGPRVLVHADLGVTEWKQSLPWCAKLSSRLGLDLIVVRRTKGDMMERWEQRWRDNLARYVDLLCVQLILPWSTPGMRFCTSEMKTSPICRELIRRFPGQTIISATGIRKEESSSRAKQPTVKTQAKLLSKKHGTNGIDWHAIDSWTLQDVLDEHQDNQFPLHPAYTLWLLSRVSCVFCIMSSQHDLRAAVKCPENHSIYRRMVQLEIQSTFAFHGDQWLADIAPELLTVEELTNLERAKMKAEIRKAEEAKIPEHLLYEKGWPLRIPTRSEAELLSSIRTRIAGLMNLSCRFLDPESIITRHIELMELKQRRAA